MPIKASHVTVYNTLNAKDLSSRQVLRVISLS